MRRDVLLAWICEHFARNLVMTIGAEGSCPPMRRQQVPRAAAVIECYEVSSLKFPGCGLPPATCNRAYLDLKFVRKESGEFSRKDGLSKVVFQDYLAPGQVVIGDGDSCFEPLTAAPAQDMNRHGIKQFVGEKDS